MHYLIDPFKKYACFSGRATRKQYWLFVLWLLGLEILIVIADVLFGGSSSGPDESIPVALFRLLTFIPSLAIAVRRCHDADYRGWWLLVPIMNLVLMFLPSTEGRNRFGVPVDDEINDFTLEDIDSAVMATVATEPVNKDTTGDGPVICSNCDEQSSASAIWCHKCGHRL